MPLRVPFTDIRVHYMDAPERRVLDLRRDGLPEIPLLGKYSYSRARGDLPTHRHLGVVEICYLERGRQVFEVEGHEHRLSGGDILVTQPGQPHSTDGQPSEPGVLYWLNLRLPKPGGRLLLLPASDTESLLEGLRTLPRPCFRGSSRVGMFFETLLAWHDHPQALLQTTRMRLTAIQLLLEVIDCSWQQSAGGVSPVIADVIARIGSRPEGEFRLEELARRTGLSLSRFKVRFKAETGMSPRQFILRGKVVLAKQRLLATSDSVSRIAMDLGFPTPQYFATVFKRFLGQTPKAFRQEGGAGKGPSRRSIDGQG